MQRSPLSGSGSISGRSDSYPNLSNKHQILDTSDATQITFRNKRKLENDDHEFKTQFAEMRKQMTEMQKQMSEMMAYLTSINSMQVENFGKISEDICVIKDQVKNIKSTTDCLTKEQANIKVDIENLKKRNSTAEKKIEILESNLQLENTAAPNSSFSINTREELVTELNERASRGKNIIISGIPEPKAKSSNERREEDKEAVKKIISTLSIDSLEPEKIFRLGKYQSTKIRPLKVCYGSQNIAINILRCKDNLKADDIKIYSDQTPQQQAYMKSLKEELKRRTASGEANIAIKYVRGVPKIIETLPKNLTYHHITTPSSKM